MGVDIDIVEHCKRIKEEAKGPPYHCPLAECNRPYKSICSLQFHLQNYNHDNPPPIVLPPAASLAAATESQQSSVTSGIAVGGESAPVPSKTPNTKTKTPKNKKGRSRMTKSATKASASVAVTPANKLAGAPLVPEPLTFEEAQKMVQFEVDGMPLRWNINEALDVVCSEDVLVPKTEVEEPEKPSTNLVNASVKPSSLSKSTAIPSTPVSTNKGPSKAAEPSNQYQLPEAKYTEVEDYNICDAPTRPNAYIRFIEKSTEELDGEVEYDVDEEDTTWLAIMNEKREASGLAPVSVDSLELLMDRLEKESYFQASANGQTSAAVVDDDAVCCICMDGECQNTNVILFCDMCNLAVHQDCYGVPYIPEGQWLCRRCLQSPSKAVDCVLCPNQGGAFKQTDRGLWAHVVCALWIPEVRFANTVFLEPIDSIETIPAARWKLTCYVCKQRGKGACIQCHKHNCYAAFHVTCAQQAGLYMKMDTVKESGGGGGSGAGSSTDLQPVLVQKIAYCDVHAPPDKEKDEESTEQKKKGSDAQQKMKQARKMLAKKRTGISAPVILIPTIPPDRVQEISTLVTIAKKQQFIQRLIAYWTLKRQFRNGVPLLRRLQSNNHHHHYNGIGGGGLRDGAAAANSSNSAGSASSLADTIELCKQLKYWQCLRQDLERARLLCELVRKREKIKLEYTRVWEKCMRIELSPLQASLINVLDLIASKDVNEIFLEPVDIEEVPDYTTVVTDPMDLSTMRKKLEDGLYSNGQDGADELSLMEEDFKLMINNCLAYNNKDTMFYRAGIKMRDQGAVIFKQARKELVNAGLLPSPEALNKNDEDSHQEDLSPSEIDQQIKRIKGMGTDLEKQKAFDKLLAKCLQQEGAAVAKRIKLIRTELTKLEKRQSKCNDSQSDVDGGAGSATSANVDESKATSISATTPNVGGSIGTSPTSGVNRRTAVLFTRKAQAALKKPLEEKEDKDSPSTSTSDVAASAGTDSVKNVNTEKNNTKKKGKSRRKSTHDSEKTDSANKANSNSQNDGQPSVPDSFKVYRATGHQSSADEHSDSGTSLSTCYSHESSEIDSDDDDDDDENENGSDDSARSGKSSNKKHSKGSESKLNKLEHLKPLQMVWAKCRGYPWYPALIIDPEMPKGYVHHGVPIPSPPAEVLALKSQSSTGDEQVYLVLFFDAKRTWQFLPAGKLELMGVDTEKDEAKVNESKKPTDRKAVRKAYEHALQYQEQISEPPGPGAIR